MRIVATICKILMWVFMGFYLLVNGMAIFAIASNNSAAQAAGQTAKIFAYYPIVISLALMLAACILFVVVKKWRLLWIGLAVVAALVMLVTALELGRALPLEITSYGDKGLTTWKLIWRHIGIAVVAVLMFAAWLTGRAADKAEEAWRKAHKAERQFDLSGDSIFRDDSGKVKIIEDDEDEDGEAVVRRPKRSVQKRLEKELERQNAKYNRTEDH